MLCIPSTDDFNAVPSLQCVDLKVGSLMTCPGHLQLSGFTTVTTSFLSCKLVTPDRLGLPARGAWRRFPARGQGHLP